MANKFADIHKKQSEQPKFADKNPKNPNAREPIVQNPDWEGVKKNSYERADNASKAVQERQAATQKKVDDHVKAQQAPSTQSKFGAKMQKTAKAEQPAPNKNEPKR